MFQPFCGNRAFAVDGVKQIYLDGNPGIKFERANKPQPAQPEPASKTINVIQMPNGDRVFILMMRKGSPDFGDLPTDLKLILQAYAL